MQLTRTGYFVIGRSLMNPSVCPRANARYNREADDIGLDDVDPNSEFPSYRNEHGAAR